MKLLFGIVPILFASFSAHALRLNKEQLLNPKLIQASSAKKLKLELEPIQPGQPAEPIQPIPVEPIPPTRMGRIKFEVSKSQVIKNPDGTYSSIVTSVCSGEMDMPVWDVRNITNGGYFDTGSMQVCNSTLDGQPVKLNIGGHLWIANRDRFGEPPQAEKSGSAYMYTDGPVIDPNNWMQFADNPGTRDLMNRSLLGQISQNVTVCSPAEPGSGEMICEVTVGEYFSASFELIDNP